MANEQNLKPFTSDQSREEAVKNGSKGGKKSGEVRSVNAAMRKRLEQIIKMTLREGKADKIKNLAAAKGANLTVSDAMLIKLVTMAMSGNLKAMDRLFDLLGMDSPEPPEPPQAQANSFIDALNYTAAEVWANENETPEKEKL